MGFEVVVRWIILIVIFPQEMAILNLVSSAWWRHLRASVARQNYYSYSYYFCLGIQDPLIFDNFLFLFSSFFELSVFWGTCPTSFDFLNCTSLETFYNWINWSRSSCPFEFIDHFDRGLALASHELGTQRRPRGYCLNHALFTHLISCLLKSWHPIVTLLSRRSF